MTLNHILKLCKNVSIDFNRLHKHIYNPVLLMWGGQGGQSNWGNTPQGNPWGQNGMAQGGHSGGHMGGGTQIHLQGGGGGTQIILPGGGGGGTQMQMGGGGMQMQMGGGGGHRAHQHWQQNPFYKPNQGWGQHGSPPMPQWQNKHDCYIPPIQFQGGCRKCHGSGTMNRHGMPIPCRNCYRKQGICPKCFGGGRNYFNGRPCKRCQGGQWQRRGGHRSSSSSSSSDDDQWRGQQRGYGGGQGGYGGGGHGSFGGGPQFQQGPQVQHGGPGYGGQGSFQGGGQW